MDDSAIRESILASNGNVMISAGAGAGKTEIMSLAVIRRLLRDKTLNESNIVVITFTNAAAAELKNRLAQKYREIKAEAAKKGEAIRQINIDDIHISTIHSFCSSLILQKVFDCDLGMSPVITEKSDLKNDPEFKVFIKDYFRQNKEDYQYLHNVWDYQTNTLVINTLKSIADKENLSIQLPDAPDIDEKQKIDEIKTLLRKINEKTKDMTVTEDSPECKKNIRETALSFDKQMIYATLNNICKNAKIIAEVYSKSKAFALYMNCKEKSDDCINELKKAGYDPEARISKKNDLLKNKDILEDTLGQIKKLLQENDNASLMKSYFSKKFVELGEMLLNGNDYNNDALKEAFKTLKKPENFYNKNKLKEDNYIKDLPEGIESYFRSLSDIAEPLLEAMVLKTAAVIRKMYDKFDKRERSDVDSNHLLHLAMQLVCGKNREENLRYFREKYKVFFIDEFQDTDYLQLNIFTALASDDAGNLRNGSLFIVGDPKQSIYRFRGAEVGFYEYVHHKYFEDKDFYELTVNYRSEKAIVDKVNELYSSDFKNMFGYQEMVPFKVCDNKSIEELEKEGKQILHPGMYDLYGMDYDRVAKLVTGLLGHEFAFAENKKDTENQDNNTQKNTKNIEYGDILILTDFSAQATEIYDRLRKAGYPVLVSGSILPAEKKALQRLRALMSYLERSSRYRLAELCAAFAPTENSDEMGSLSVRYTNDEADALYEILKECRSVLYEQGALEVIYTAVRKGWLLDRKTDAAALISEMPMLYQFLESISCEAVDNIKSVNTYIDSFMNSSFKNQLEPALHNNCIRVMNLHQAKGLQGNVVIYYQDRTKSHPLGSVFKYMDENNAPVSDKALCYPALSIKGNNVFPTYGDDISKAEKQQVENEKIRLSYVRDTRAAFIMINAHNNEEKAAAQSTKDNKASDTSKTSNNVQAQSPDDQAQKDPNAPVKKLMDTKNTAIQHELLSISERNEKYTKAEFFDAAVSPSLLEIDVQRQSSEKSGEPDGALYGTIMHRAFELFFENKKAGKAIDVNETDRCIAQAMLENMDQFSEDEMTPENLRQYEKKLKENMKDLIDSLKEEKIYDMQFATETPFYCIVDPEPAADSDDKMKNYHKKLRALISSSMLTDDEADKLRRVYFSGKSDLTLFYSGKYNYRRIIDYKSDKRGYSLENIKKKYRPQQESYILVSAMYQNDVDYPYLYLKDQTLFAPNAFDDRKWIMGELGIIDQNS